MLKAHPASSSHSISKILLASLICSPAALLAQSNRFVATNSPKGPIHTTATTPAPSRPVREFSTSVRNGILTVDGMVGKAGMNYDIHQSFMYFTIPGVGTAIVAQTHFMNAAPQKDAFHGDELTINVNGHSVELTNSGPLVGEKSEDAWVAIDPLYGSNIRFPEMGFGDSTQRPYAWPGSKNIALKANVLVTPPPLPPSVQPKPEISSSYTVTVPGTERKGNNQ